MYIYIYSVGLHFWQEGWNLLNNVLVTHISMQNHNVNPNFAKYDTILDEQNKIIRFDHKSDKSAYLIGMLHSPCKKSTALQHPCRPAVIIHQHRYHAVTKYNMFETWHMAFSISITYSRE